MSDGPQMVDPRPRTKDHGAPTRYSVPGTQPGRWLIALIVMVALAVGAVQWVRAAPERRAAADALWRDVRYPLIGTWTRWTQPALETADVVPIRHTSVSPFGINTFVHLEADEWKRRRTFEMIRDAGFRFVREQFPWQDIERLHKGGYLDERHNFKSTWELYDNVVDLAVEHGLELIVRLDYAPDWSRPAGFAAGHPYGPPDRLEDYADFVATVVSRYRGRVRYFQIWNEPNTCYEWGQQPVDPAAYVEMLRLAYHRAKAANPDAVILSAALAPTLEENACNLNDLVFIRRMYEAGAKGHFDILSVNPYGLRAGPDDRRFTPHDTNFSRPVLARQIMVELGDTETPIWASELGWNALPYDFPEPPDFGRVTRDQQARYTVRAYERAAEEWPWMGVMMLWSFKSVGDQARLAAWQPHYFDIVDQEFRPYPIYTALTELMRRPPILHRGYRQEDHPAIVWDEGWRDERDPRASLGALRRAEGPGARLTFGFEGTYLALVVRTGPDGGRANVWIDGSPWAANRLPKRANGRAYLETYAPAEGWQQTVLVAQRLARGRHTVTIEVAPDRHPDASGQSVAVDAVVVETRAAPDEPTALALVALGLIGWVGWIRARRHRRSQLAGAPTTQAPAGATRPNERG